MVFPYQEVMMAKKDERTCPQCGGTGQILIKDNVYVRCQMCGGRGTVPA